MFEKGNSDRPRELDRQSKFYGKTFFYRNTLFLRNFNLKPTETA